jgi:hypothetical protein
VAQFGQHVELAVGQGVADVGDDLRGMPVEVKKSRVDRCGLVSRD